MTFFPQVPTVGNAATPLAVTLGGTGAATAAAAATALGFMTKLADAGTAGLALINGTQNLCTYTTANDGNLHPVLCVATLLVSSLETGGATGITFTDPSNAVNTNFPILAGAQAAGPHLWGFTTFLAHANTAVSLVQTSALTAGAAVFYGQIWGV